MARRLLTRTKLLEKASATAADSRTNAACFFRFLVSSSGGGVPRCNGQYRELFKGWAEAREIEVDAGDPSFLELANTLTDCLGDFDLDVLPVVDLAITVPLAARAADE
jgi:hypothetical protein